VTESHIAAVDVGGTHTDAVLLRGDGRLFTSKVKSTPSAPGEALLAAVEEIRAASGLGAGELAAIVHGTTVATNALLTGRLGRVGLIATEGFRDTLEIGSQQRADLYEPWIPAEPPFVPRERRVEVSERIGYDGTVLRPLDRASVERAVESLRGEVDVVAVCLLFSYANDAHERQVKEIVEELLPGIPVTLSSQVAPEFREYPRTATTAVNAALLPVTGAYIDGLDRELAARDYTGAFQLMHSNGGVVPAAHAARTPVTLLVSGPAAGAVGAAYLAREAGFDDVVMLDMGGTSADVALITGGEPQRRYRGAVGSMPITVPQIDVLPIGAGGGSIARVDAFGSLSVGPESAGADPGPAAYGVGDEATVTDAHLVLGTLDPDRFLGGRLVLDVARSREVIERRVARPLDLSVEAAAAAILRIADGKMANALRMITVARGFDVRRCVLVAFGGAGPLHAVSIAEELGITSVLVPRYPGLTSALGLVVSDGRFDVSRTFIGNTARIDYPRLTEVLGELRGTLDGMLASAHAADDARIELDLDIRYEGQAYELTIPCDSLTPGPEQVAAVLERFHQAHRGTYGHAWPERPTELVNLRMRALVPRATPDWAEESASGESAATTTREGRLLDGEPTTLTIVDRSRIETGMTGPLVVEQSDSTTVVPAGWRIGRIGPTSFTAERIEEEA